jgi:hypothetical protein
MNDDSTRSELAIRYLDNELSAEERAAFETSMQSDPALEEEVRNLDLARAAINDYGIRGQVKTVHQQMMRELRHESASASNVRQMLRRALSIAASIIVLVAAFGVYQYASTSPQKLYADHYELYMPGTSRGDNSESTLVQAFRNKSWQQVVTVFHSLQQPTVQDRFLAGQSLLALDSTHAAITQFRELLSNTSSSHADYRDDAEYYLGLTYIKNNQAALAEPIFRKIYEDKNHLYHDKVDRWFLMKLRLLKWKQ